MFRQPITPCAWLTMALGLAVFAAPGIAWSQDYSTQQRLDRLERDLNMLQRQVYRGGAPAGGTDGSSGAAVSAEVRMERLEAQMRDLTGRVEEFTNQIEQVRQRIEQINSDVEMRFSQGGGGPSPIAAAAPPPRAAPPPPGRQARQLPPPVQPPQSDDDSESSGDGPVALMPPGTAVPPPGYANGGAPAGSFFGTLTPPGTLGSAPRELASTAPPPRSSGGLPNGSATEQYNYAFGLLKQADYPAAEAALKAFVEQHPKDTMAGNAQYWLGETFYTRGKYMEAAAAFAEGYKRYPKAAKAPDNLLKLGMALARADQKQNACVALAQLDRDFPKPGASVRERAGAEKKRLGC
ncbi:MAG TPA: tol-pal system protein YbgF [Stellaceae bacterium]|nr:tol-pal system protein YbgF [Stellaceae bacterium]